MSQLSTSTYYGWFTQNNLSTGLGNTGEAQLGTTGLVNMTLTLTNTGFTWSVNNGHASGLTCYYMASAD